MSRLRRAALIVLALLVVLGLGSLLFVRSARPPRSGALTLPGLRDPAEVWRDSLAVPHVFAADETDLLFLQGWLHAQDRLWQMELLRRAGQGRLSELFGARTLAADRFLHVFELLRASPRPPPTPPPARDWTRMRPASTPGWPRATARSRLSSCCSDSGRSRGRACTAC